MKAPEASRSGSRCRAKAIAFSSWSGTWVRVPIYLHRPRACAPRHRGTGAGLPGSGYASSPCGAPRHQPPPPPPPTPLPTEPPEKPDPDEVGAAAIPPVEVKVVKCSIAPAVQKDDVPTYHVGVATGWPSAAASANTFVQCSATPKAIAYGRYREKMSFVSSNCSWSASAVSRYFLKPRVCARTAVPAAVRAGAAIAEASTTMPTSTTPRPIAPAPMVSPSRIVSPTPTVTMNAPQPTHRWRTRCGEAANHFRSTTRSYSSDWACDIEAASSGPASFMSTTVPLPGNSARSTVSSNGARPAQSAWSASVTRC